MYELLHNWIFTRLDPSIGLYLFLLFICIFAGFYLLIKGGDWLSDHSANVASQLGVPPVVVGLTIVSIATSTPELFTSIAAIRSDSPGLVLGNIIGSNIANIGLILGVSLLLGNIDTKGAVSRPQRICLCLLTLSFCGILFFHPREELGEISGTVFLLFIIIYVIVVSSYALKRTKQRTGSTDLSSYTTHSDGPTLVYSLAIILFATLTLWAGSDTLVFGSKNLASLGGVPEELIGFTLIALGTSLPELAASISLVRKQQTSMLLGNIVGSNLFNISLIGGIAGVLGPVRCYTPLPWVDYISLILISLFLIYWLKGKVLQKTEGLILLILYLVACVSTWLLNT